MCGAIVVSGLGRVATAHQIAPWSEEMSCLSHHAVGAAFRSTSVWTVSNFLDAVARAVWRVPACDWLVMAMATASRKLDTGARGATAEK